MKPPSRKAVLLGLVPFVAVCFSVPLWDRVDPTVLGLPFNIFWLVTWLLLTPLVMWGVYRIEAQRSGEQRDKGSDQ
jgi:Protein of unknown function (DUF3311)